ncbi:hypothetical protein HDV05_005743 [Chytridiales sp. JEL 0842]|nr:hypothetical protein HDV05_005743 [Chytridiales sp. JEL 0842]
MFGAHGAKGGTEALLEMLRAQGEVIERQKLEMESLRKGLPTSSSVTLEAPEHKNEKGEVVESKTTLRLDDLLMQLDDAILSTQAIQVGREEHAAVEERISEGWKEVRDVADYGTVAEKAWRQPLSPRPPSLASTTTPPPSPPASYYSNLQQKQIPTYALPPAPNNTNTNTTSGTIAVGSRGESLRFEPPESFYLQTKAFQPVQQTFEKPTQQEEPLRQSERGRQQSTEDGKENEKKKKARSKSRVKKDFFIGPGAMAGVRH